MAKIYFLDYVKNNKNVTCISNQNIMNLKKKYKNIRSFIKGDGKSLPFKDNQFDISYSSATIEHVGSKKEQLQFLKESIRVSKKYIFITTPNRFFPIDFHTKLPLIHWLPKKVHRKILNFLNLKFYAKEKNLNLLDEKEILSLLNKVNYSSFKIRKIFLLFFCSNLLIIIKK
jgi:ubiquinone/menaquinone biosynthesis C-methylase UbiE